MPTNTYKFLTDGLFDRQQTMDFKTCIWYLLLLLRHLAIDGANNRLLVFSVTPFKIDQNKKAKPFNRLSKESGNRKKVDMPRFRSQQLLLWKICEETFSPNI